MKRVLLFGGAFVTGLAAALLAAAAMVVLPGWLQRESWQAQPAPAKAVVKPAAPAAGNTKILPKTGLQTGAPVVFVVMLAAAPAAAAAWLVILRKKLNG